MGHMTAPTSSNTFGPVLKPFWLLFDDVGRCWMFLVLNQDWISKDWLGQFKQFYLYATMFDDVGPALFDPI